jgi:hypothetical protein
LPIKTFGLLDHEAAVDLFDCGFFLFHGRTAEAVGDGFPHEPEALADPRQNHRPFENGLDRRWLHAEVGKRGWWGGHGS